MLRRGGRYPNIAGSGKAVGVEFHLIKIGAHIMTADARYDAIVVGGGHHGTIIACYLARAGLRVAVFERKSHFGGGATSGRGQRPVS
jgi:ribulose 1,5-bisphosphate synthetase/thiazole synthase